MDEYLRIYRESVMPIIRELPGAKHVFVFTDAETNKVTSVGIYETKADAERTQSSGDFQKLVDMMIGTLIPESIGGRYGDGPSQPFKIIVKLFQERAERHPILRFSASKRTFSTPTTRISSIFLYCFQNRNYLEQLLTSSRFYKGIRVNL